MFLEDDGDCLEQLEGDSLDELFRVVVAHGERLAANREGDLVVHVFRQAGLAIDQERLSMFRAALHRIAQDGDERCRRRRAQGLQ